MKRGERIRKRRKALKMSADELGKKIGRDRATVYRYEGEYVEKLDIDVLRAIADALHTSVQYLTGETDDPEDVWSRPLVDAPLVLTDDEEVLIHKLRELPDRDRNYVLKILDFVYSAYQRYIEEGSDDAGV